MYQCEAGTQCPQTMTFAGVPPLQAYANEQQKLYAPRPLVQLWQR